MSSSSWPSHGAALDAVTAARADRVLGCRGLRCPLPAIYARKALAEMHGGETLMVIATDPGSVTDFTELDRRGLLRLVHHGERDGEHTFFVRRR
jgi:tRNA 2-thiouridine synthesizing protein A